MIKKTSIALLLFLSLNSQNLIFNSQSKNIPAPEKRAKGGEDAHFNNQSILAVADGVGGWNEAGVDPALYSRKLIDNVKTFFSQNKNHYSEFPKSLTIEAALKNHETGTSTLVIATIDPNTNELVTCNIGDSGFIILRKENDVYKKIFRSKEQQHGFNFPFQIGTDGDDPSLAQVQRFKIVEEDLVILGSDGLFDNLYDKDIEEVCNSVNNRMGLDLKKLAGILAHHAEELSLDTSYLSPFAKNAKDNNINFVGGKSDDITVVVAEIFRER